RPAVKKDKENMCDEPVDMSTNKSDAKKEKRGPSPDVIVLSDNESSSPTANGYCKDEAYVAAHTRAKSSTPEEREKMIKRLKDELRLEEAKLVLLKKLRQSQMQKENVTQKQMTMPRNQGSVVPPPLVRGGQQGPPKFSHHQSSQVVMPPLVRGPQRLEQMHGSRPGTAPPPLMMAPRVTTPSQMQGSRGLSSSGLVRVTTVTPPTSGVVNYTQSMVRGSGGASSSPTPARSESPASRQAAAKLALRKQLEKTLLEIPPPKPPPPELNFLPSAANSEFVYLIGLEEVVQSLLETQGKAAPQPMGREPFKCLQCQTDFTARWRHEKGGTVICEQCLSSNQKKALKAEHTNRLKMAFVKALQQEQEIEQQIQQQTVSTPTQNAKSHMQQLPLKQQQSTRPSQSMVQRGHQPPHRGVLHSFPQPPQMQASSKLLGLQAGVNMAYVTPNLSGQHKPSTSTAASPAERQREYLLDMLPSRSISHPTVHRP
uniref:GATA-type domain-containing protein n=1 Tax=Petromyzon marinus TaxID=7757 RepID=S4R759_PETMA